MREHSEQQRREAAERMKGYLFRLQPGYPKAQEALQNIAGLWSGYGRTPMEYGLRIEPTPESVERVLAMLADERDEVRLRVLVALEYCPDLSELWYEAVHRTARIDEDPRARRKAITLLARCRTEAR